MDALPTFDCGSLLDAVDEQRVERGLGWTELAHVLHAQSHDLNVVLGDQDMCPGALVRTARRRDNISCQYALILQRWIDRAPEDFLTGSRRDVGDTTLPRVGSDRRLRWDLPRLHAALDEQRRADGLTWVALGEIIGVTPNRLTNLRTARLADVGLVLRATQWLGMPAARFVHAAEW